MATALSPQPSATADSWNKRLILSLVLAVCACAAFLPLFLDFFVPDAMIGGEHTLASLRFVSGLAIGFTYMAVSGTFIVLTRRTRKPLHFLWAFVAFGLFLLCSTTIRFISAMTDSTLVDRWGNTLTYFTTILSVAAVIAVIPLLPKILDLVQSNRLAEDRKRDLEGRNRELEELNWKLEQEMREREQAEESDRATFERLRGIVESLPLGAMVLGENQQVLYINQVACDMLGLDCSIDELIGSDQEEMFRRIQQNLIDPTTYLHILHMALHAMRPVLGIELEFNDGRTVLRDIQPIYAGETFRGSLFLYRDITREKRVDTAKSEFMSLASHQLRTPLTAIRWSLGRLSKHLDGRLEPMEAQLLQESKGGIRRMAHTIDTMLAISRIEAGKVKLEPSEVKLGLLLNDVRVDCREFFEAKKQTFTLDCEPNVLVRTDESILHEILHNLYTNAIKYTPEGGRIHVRGMSRGSWVQIDVEDTGYGIPAHQQQQIFRKFFRGENIVSMDTEGTGLGLYLVSLLVQMLQGTISFQSEEGQGTTFTVRLPVDIIA